VLVALHQVAVGEHAVSLAAVLEQLLGVHPPVTFVVVKLTDSGSSSRRVQTSLGYFAPAPFSYRKRSLRRPGTNDY